MLAEMPAMRTLETLLFDVSNARLSILTPQGTCFNQA